MRFSLTAWQATRTLVTAPSNTGDSRLQRSSAKGQRGWKVHPDGGLMGHDCRIRCLSIRWPPVVTLLPARKALYTIALNKRLLIWLGLEWLEQETTDYFLKHYSSFVKNILNSV